jgi:hypothetical protein
MLPLVAVVDTVVSAVHPPQVAPSAESLYCISYDEMAFPAPPLAPLHERVTFPSASVALRLTEVGSPAAEIEQRMLLLTTSADIAPSVSTARMRYRVKIPEVRVGEVV